MTNTSNFYERLKLARKEMGLSQAAAAEICGVKRETWSRYESGLMSPGMEVLAAIAAAGADVQYILTGLRTTTTEGVTETRAGYKVVSVTQREATLLDNYRHVPAEEDKRAIDRMALLAAKADKDETESGNKKLNTPAKDLHSQHRG